MITVVLGEANFEYDIHSLVKAFFTREDVKVCSDMEKIVALERDETPLFRLEVSYISKDTCESGMDKVCFCILEPSRQELCAHFAIKMQSETKTDFSNRKATKNQLKHCLYRMLSSYSQRTLPWGTLTGIRPVKIPLQMLEEGMEQEAVKSYMQETYLASDAKIDLSIEIAKREQELLTRIDYQQGYSLYIGIPFCPSICLYCSFSSSPLGMWKDRIDDYLDALDKEIAFTAEACKDKKLNTIYIGGGTPTTLSPSQLERLLTKIQDSFDFAHLLEFTVEAGRPDSITREKLEVLRRFKVSRISINPQTMKQETLDLIGRNHTAQQTKEAFWLARELGFDNINMDLILGLPRETIEDVEMTLEQMAILKPDNLTVHSLAIKRAARLKLFQGDFQGQMTNSWDMIDLTARYAKALGQEPYYLYRQKNMAGNFENVGYAKPGKAGIYNVLIMEEKQPIIALGAGASTKYVFDQGKRIERSENVKDIASYIERIDEMIDRKRQGFALYKK